MPAMPSQKWNQKYRDDHIPEPVPSYSQGGGGRDGRGKKIKIGSEGMSVLFAVFQLSTADVVHEERGERF